MARIALEEVWLVSQRRQIPDGLSRIDICDLVSVSLPGPAAVVCGHLGGCAGIWWIGPVEVPSRASMNSANLNYAAGKVWLWIGLE